jgi:ribonucleoside-diphosphate reductase beta chain
MSIEERPVDETRANDELERAGGPVDALYAHWERHQWSALELDFSADAATFAALDESEREGLIWIFANRFHAEFNVARLLAPFLLAAPDWGMQLLLATQVADEHRHLQVVLRIYDEVFGIRGGLEGARERADRDLDPVSKALLYDKLEHWVLPLEHRRDPDTFLKAVLVYHVLGEGVIARTGQNLAAGQYERFQGFTGLMEGQRLVARDESRHIGIGVSYLRRCMQSDPDRTRALVMEVMTDLLALADDLLATAKAGMTSLVESGYGVDPEGFYAEVMRLVDIRLRSIGFIEG